MDYQNRAGSKFGGGGIASAQEQALDRKERLRKLALETIDLATDPYILRTHVGRVECKLCATEHPDENSYLTHTQAKKHQSNLAKRQMQENKAQSLLVGPAVASKQLQLPQKKRFITIGRPHYRLRKLRAVDGQSGWLVTIHFPQIRAGVRPVHRWMASHDPDQIRYAKDASVQYLLIAAEPYETIAFELQANIRNKESGDLEWIDWDENMKIWQFQFMVNGQ